MSEDRNQNKQEPEDPLINVPRGEEMKGENGKTKRTESKGEITKLAGEIENLKAEKAQLSDKYLRLAAEFDNFRKLMAKENDNRIRNVIEAVLLDVLPILDDLERALNSIPEEEKKGTLTPAVTLIRDNMKQTLKKYGLEEIESVGKEFNIDLHDALMMTQDKNYPSGYVVQEHQKGYKLNDRVIRHAKVAVNKIEE